MRLSLTILTLTILASCDKRISNIRSIYDVPELTSEVQIDDKFIKVHLKDGKLAVLRRWEVDHEQEKITGDGYLFGRKNREKLNEDIQNYVFDFDKCILIETNQYDGFDQLNFGMVMTIAMTGISIPCLFDPKACFGSCPTFYLHKGDSMIIQAEGFSSSITKSMEAMDIDHLPAYESSSDELKIELKNEAWETHYIRSADILVLPRSTDGEIYSDGNRFYYVTNKSFILETGEEIADLLSNRDGIEYLNSSDSIDLARKESIVLDFEPQQGKNSGVLITQRQSFMTTYLFYQSMAFMGSGVGELMAAYENASPIVRNAQKTMYDILGGVEVSVLIDDKWEKIGSVEEQGPIVTDTHLIPVRLKGEISKVKLTMTKGLWRIDQVALGTIEKEVDPVILQPKMLLDNEINSAELLDALTDEEKMLVNNPGTSYTLVYDNPGKGPLSIFLRSQGYYTEWMREDWLKEEDPEMVQLIIKKPRKWLKLMAPRYKTVEAEMESLFWASKFGSHEN